MRKPQIEDAYAEQTPLFYSRYKDWAKGYGGAKVTLMTSQHAHWLFNHETARYEAQKYASTHRGRITQTGYQVQDDAGSVRIVTATQLRGTWADCQKTITDNNQAAKDAAQRDQQRRIAFEEVIDDIGAFGLHVQSWSIEQQHVIVSGPALLALLREMMGAAQQ